MTKMFLIVALAVVVFGGTAVVMTSHLYLAAACSGPNC
jgi:hypothetical protein